jgi:hypothetical protein
MPFGPVTNFLLALISGTDISKCTKIVPFYLCHIFVMFRNVCFLFLISSGQSILRVAIAQLATYKIYLVPVIFQLRFWNRM